MNVRLGNFSEISKLLSVKSKMSGDILSLSSKFGLGYLLCRLSLEKHDGISAVQLILSLCLFRINGETIHSIYKKNFYHLLETGKNCYYRMMVRQTMDWRRLLNYTVLRFESLLRKNGVKTESEDSCVIFDDTTLEKTGRKLEHITKVFDHVKMNYVLGYIRERMPAQRPHQIRLQRTQLPCDVCRRQGTAATNRRVCIAGSQPVNAQQLWPEGLPYQP